MKKTVLIYGLIAGLIVSAIMSVSMITLYHNPESTTTGVSMIIGYLSMLIAFSMIFVAVKEFRDTQNGGLISFGKAFSIGILIALIGSAMYVISWAIVYNFFVPDFMERYAGRMVKEAQATLSKAELQKKNVEIAQFAEMYKNPFFFTLMTFAEIFPVGLLVSLICALILKRKTRREDLVTT